MVRMGGDVTVLLDLGLLCLVIRLNVQWQIQGRGEELQPPPFFGPTLCIISHLYVIYRSFYFNVHDFNHAYSFLFITSSDCKCRNRCHSKRTCKYTSLCHPGHTCTNNEKATTHDVNIDCDKIDADSTCTSSSQSNVWLNCCGIIITNGIKISCCLVIAG